MPQLVPNMGKHRARWRGRNCTTTKGQKLYHNLGPKNDPKCSTENVAKCGTVSACSFRFWLLYFEEALSVPPFFQNLPFRAARSKMNRQKLYHLKGGNCTTFWGQEWTQNVVQVLPLEVVQFLPLHVALCFPIFGTNWGIFKLSWKPRGHIGGTVSASLKFWGVFYNIACFSSRKERKKGRKTEKKGVGKEKGMREDWGWKGEKYQEDK